MWPTLFYWKVWQRFVVVRCLFFCLSSSAFNGSMRWFILCYHLYCICKLNISVSLVVEGLGCLVCVCVLQALVAVCWGGFVCESCMLGLFVVACVWGRLFVRSVVFCFVFFTSSLFMVLVRSQFYMPICWFVSFCVHLFIGWFARVFRFSFVRVCVCLLVRLMSAVYHLFIRSSVLSFIRGGFC